MDIVADEPMDEPAPSSSPTHAGITLGKAQAHYTDMVLEEREAMFCAANLAYNLRLFDENRHAGEHLAASTTTKPARPQVSPAKRKSREWEAAGARVPRRPPLLPSH